MSAKFRTPVCIKELGQTIVTAYWKKRGDLINDHNKRVEEEIDEESDMIRKITWGSPSVNVQTMEKKYLGAMWGPTEEGDMVAVQNSRLNYSDGE